MRRPYLVRLAVVCLAMVFPAVAYAAGESHRAAAGSIHVSADRGKTKVSVHIPGMLDRVIWLGDQIYSVALADLNHDGRLDLVASTRRHLLVVWRNTPHGFVRQHVPRPEHRVRYGRSLAPATGGPAAAQATDEHRDPIDVVPGTRLIGALLPTEHLVHPGEQSAAAPFSVHFGRAPPETV